MALDSVVSAVGDPGVDDDPEPSPRPEHGLVRWGASRWSWYDDTAASRMRGAARQSGPATPRPVRSSAA